MNTIYTTKNPTITAYNELKMDLFKSEYKSITFFISLHKVKNDIKDIIIDDIKNLENPNIAKRLHDVIKLRDNYNKVNLSLQFDNMFFNTIEKVTNFLANIDIRDDQKEYKKLFNAVDKKQDKKAYNKSILEIIPKIEKTDDEKEKNILELISKLDTNHQKNILEKLQKILETL